jgi:hypothetical protein
VSLELVRTVADAVLYEGYLLYPYRASSSKNRSRWQWGVVGPPGAAEAGMGEESTVSTQCLLDPTGGADGLVRLYLRFLQLQTRRVEQVTDAEATAFAPVAELSVSGRTWTSWDEAVEHEVELRPVPIPELAPGTNAEVAVEGGDDAEPLRDHDGRLVGRLVRRREPLTATVDVHADVVSPGGLLRLSVSVRNRGAPVDLRATADADTDAAAAATAAAKDDATRRSLIGAHLVLVAEQAQFVSLLEPPDAAARDAAATCVQRRCWPVLAGAPGDRSIVLASPIILYDYPEVAEQSAGALFDSTEIDEILTLRVMTLTDEEKAAARATDPRAAEIIDRCEQLSPDSMQALHGVLRDPHSGMAGLPDLDQIPVFTEIATDAGGADVRTLDSPSFDTAGTPWWDPAADAAVRPEYDTVLVKGVPVRRDSLVRLQPSRRADAQDLFFTGQTAKVTAVLSDVDGDVHVAVVLVDDPAADVHEWYGRYLYFSPDELEPLGRSSPQTPSDHREESRS